ncbi:MAG: tetratricopeptide repeat protein [Desulfobacula sp.]|uniref:SPOR domain-containing protein n=1 Tax=Desulfobacula sp. TaxID=2593537 RepID=UPI001DA3DBF7|nr:tetratricopeptide repeat protein [Desulfobacula sp.]MBT3486136.1 tetratricopeptide repeat protein [Desulfobacula sp.]MBT4024896.1 tetratricopeptide repeat protein [Desulfobacula sp.]MBT4198786.1 tetratricopeptide repeat protein [Desulfobacula sp.]MBT5545648.1 tetratricopeptide repeat protein [Desulfobacula sp.]
MNLLYLFGFSDYRFQHPLLFILLSLSFSTIIYAETAKGLFDNGVLYFKQGQYQKAVDEFTKLIEIAPDNADAYKNRGVSRMKQEKFDLAIQDFTKAQELFPGLNGLHSNLGVAWFYKKEYKKAIENYDIEIATSPENHVAYFNRALCLAELGRNSEALDDISQTLELQPDFYLAICYKADLLAKLGENAKALETYEAAIKHTYATKKLDQLKQKIQEIKNSKSKKDKSKNNKAAENVPEIKNTSNRGYSLQTGAFLNPENANKAKYQLLEYGLDPRILVIQDKKGRVWYLVRLGDYSSKTEAQESRLVYREELGIKSVIRSYGVW